MVREHLPPVREKPEEVVQIDRDQVVMRSVTSTRMRSQDDNLMGKIFHPRLALLASGTDRELAKYVQFLKEENKILRSRIKGEVYAKPEER